MAIYRTPVLGRLHFTTQTPDGPKSRPVNRLGCPVTTCEFHHTREDIQRLRRLCDVLAEFRDSRVELSWAADALIWLDSSARRVAVTHVKVLIVGRYTLEFQCRYGDELVRTGWVGLERLPAAKPPPEPRTPATPKPKKPKAKPSASDFSDLL